MEKHSFENQLFKNQRLQNHTLDYCKFLDCSFENCTFEEGTLIGCKFINCRFDQCTIISLKSKYSEIKNAVFHKCSAEGRIIMNKKKSASAGIMSFCGGIHWHTLLPSGKYPYAVNALENCCIKYNTFTEMNFTKFNFSDSIILESLFENCNLTECNFKNCRLEGTQFFKCNLQKADFRDAKGYVIDIHNNQMKAARFSFPDVIRLLETLNIKIE